VGSKVYMIEAIKAGVVDVVKFPLVKQSMRTLWWGPLLNAIMSPSSSSSASS
jgi:hypothetical protein